MEDFSHINGEGTVLRAAQLKMLDILLEIDRICKKHDLSYWLDFGTLLGAVRHKGFIPWDDDIDVSMTSDSFKKFQEIAQNELAPQFVLQTRKTEPESLMGYGLYKVRMKDTLYLTSLDSFEADYSKGLSVDIFESVPYPTVNRKLYMFIVKRICKSFGFMSYHKHINFGNIIRYFVFPAEFVFFYSVWKVLCLLKKKDRELTPITRVLYGYPCLKSDLYPLGTIEFEGHTFPCPRDPHARLKEWCADYMQLPPVEKRKVHAKFICLDTKDCYKGIR